MSAKICRRKAFSNTGIVGVCDTVMKGRTAFSVFWTTGKRRRHSTTIYYGGKLSREEALAKAVALRRSKISARAAMKPEPHGSSSQLSTLNSQAPQ
jgi:hypothetical protein